MECVTHASATLGFTVSLSYLARTSCVPFHGPSENSAVESGPLRIPLTRRLSLVRFRRLVEALQREGVARAPAADGDAEAQDDGRVRRVVAHRTRHVHQQGGSSGKPRVRGTRSGCVCACDAHTCVRKDVVGPAAWSDFEKMSIDVRVWVWGVRALIGSQVTLLLGSLLCLVRKY